MATLKIKNYMSKRAIKLWAIVIVISILGVIATYVLLGNNGSSVSNQNIDNNVNNNSSNSPATSPSNEATIEEIEQYQGSGDYYYWSIMPLRLQSKLPNPRSSSVLDYYYSKELGIAFSYEVVNITNKDTFLTLSEANSNLIYLHNFGEAKEAGQSIEIIKVDSEYIFNDVEVIIRSQLLDPKQRELCKIDEKNNRYSIIAKDTKVKDSTPICGKYAKGNNRFFVKPNEEGISSTTKLIFVTAGDKEISFDGSGNSRYWYESVILE